MHNPIQHIRMGEPKQKATVSECFGRMLLEVAPYESGRWVRGNEPWDKLFLPSFGTLRSVSFSDSQQEAAKMI